MKPSCQQVSQLVSDSHERQLTLSERLRLRLHLLMCSLCKAYERDIRLLKSVCALLQKEQVRADVCMSAEEHERIRQALLRNSTRQPQNKDNSSS